MLRCYLKLAALILMMTLITGELFAGGPGGIITNQNESAEWVRTLNRYASTDVDAVFFNPAGTVKLEDGTNIGFSNQDIYTRFAYNDDSPLLPRDQYNSYLNGPIYPNLHIAYKREKIVYMFGLDIMTGGGAGTHEDGMPSTDAMGIILGGGDDVKSELSGYFVGPSLTIGAAYAVNDIYSLSLQARYIYTIGATSASVTPYLSGVAQTTEELDMTLKGDSYGFIVGANISPMEDLNIGLRYSYYTKMELEQEIHDGKDLYGVFAGEDGKKVDKTLPQDITIGVSYHITPRWRVESGFIFYYNEGTNWSDEKGPNIENGWEAGVGTEYAVIPDKLLTSIGFLYTKSGLPDELQSEMENKFNAYNVGAGATYFIKPNLNVTIGYLYSWCDKAETKTMYESTQILGTTVHIFTLGFNTSF